MLCTYMIWFGLRRLLKVIKYKIIWSNLFLSCVIVPETDVIRLNSTNLWTREIWIIMISFFVCVYEIVSSLFGTVSIYTIIKEVL